MQFWQLDGIINARLNKLPLNLLINVVYHLLHLYPLLLILDLPRVKQILILLFRHHQLLLKGIILQVLLVQSLQSLAIKRTVLDKRRAHLGLFLGLPLFARGVIVVVLVAQIWLYFVVVEEAVDEVPLAVSTISLVGIVLLEVVEG